jgi:transposase
MRSHNRLRAIRALLLGYSHDQVSELHEITRRTLLNWVKRFNDEGVDGLIERPRPGAPKKIDEKETETYIDLINHPEKVGETHWTGVKFHGYLRKRIQLDIGYSTVIRWLHDNKFRLKVPQPWPDKQDEKARQSFLERLRVWLQDEQVRLWYLDEVGIEGDPRPRRRWVKVGEKARVSYKGTHIRMNVIGLICPQTGEFYALEFSHIDSEIFQIFLDHVNQDLDLSGKRNILICDNASWHKKKSLIWGTFEPHFLPPYSPDYNPIEKLWLIMKAEWFSDFFAKTREQLIERLDKALLWIMDRQIDNKRTCAIQK